MSVTCPSGHSSTAEDYCDVCGLPIGEQPAAEARSGPASAGSSPDGGGGTPAPEPATCPNCQAVNPTDALFCEACGYDFTTGSMPRPVEPLTGPLPTAEEPAQPAQALSTAGPAPASPGDVAPGIEPGWVAEVWIDPDWYADQESADPLPSAGLPSVVPLKSRSLLIGRSSRSRGIRPDIDLGTDSGISRRHCQLTTDGTRWWVEDLGSSNGTYVGTSVGALPTEPLPPGQKRELDADDRIYLGAWTRIVIRKAQPGEV